MRYVSKNEALQSLKRSLGGQADVADQLPRNPLPASVEVTPDSDRATPEGTRELVRRLTALPEVEDVQGGAQWVEGLAQFQRLFQLVGLGVGAVLALAAILTVTTATTLVLHLRRDEMEIMRLVGAAESVIRLPRLLQGMAQGLVAGTLALARAGSGLRAGGAPARAAAAGDARAAARGLPLRSPDARPHRRRGGARGDRRAPGDDEADPRTR